MTHPAYLEAYHELTSRVLGEIALLHGKQEWEEATELVTKLRAAQDVLWERFKDQASAGVKP